jgi:methylmalonyl-CoA mutase
MINSKNNKTKHIGLIRDRTAGFFKIQGRRPRILITRIHPTASEREVKIKASAFAELGFDVDINTSVQSSNDVARLALENDVHVIGIPGISAGNQTLLSELLAALKAEDGKKIFVATWTPRKPVAPVKISKAKMDGIIIFRFDTDSTDCANRILDVLEQQLGP